MDIFVNGCLSLPEQVEKNRRDIIDVGKIVYQNKLIHDNVILSKDNWVKIDEDNYKYVYDYDVLTENSFTLLITVEKTNLSMINSINGGFEVFSKTKPIVDIYCNLWYNIS